MSKNTNKNNKWNSLVVNKLSEDMGLTTYYIRQCLNGKRNSKTSTTIKEKYENLVKEINKTLNK